MNDYINSLDIAHQWSKIATLLSCTKCGVTFWGERVVKVDGYDGIMPLNELSRKILNAAKQRFESNDLTKDEREAGLNVTQRLIIFYRLTDKRINESYLLTRIFSWFRECVLSSLSDLQGIGNGTLDSYFREQPKEDLR